MRALIESLKRLYNAGRITKDQLIDRYESGLISREEYDYIVQQQIEVEKEGGHGHVCESTKF